MMGCSQELPRAKLIHRLTGESDRYGVTMIDDNSISHYCEKLA
jgi:hypothetical protein